MKQISNKYKMVFHIWHTSSTSYRNVYITRYMSDCIMWHYWNITRLFIKENHLLTHCPVILCYGWSTDVIRRELEGWRVELFAVRLGYIDGRLFPHPELSRACKPREYHGFVKNCLHCYFVVVVVVVVDVKVQSHPNATRGLRRLSLAALACLACWPASGPLYSRCFQSLTLLFQYIFPVDGHAETLAFTDCDYCYTLVL